MTILDPEGILDPDINGQLGDDGIVGCNWQVQAAVDVTRTSTSCPITVTFNGVSCGTYPNFDYVFEVIVNDAVACPLDTVSASSGTVTTTETTNAGDLIYGRKRYLVAVAKTIPECSGVTLTVTNDCADSASAFGFNCSVCRNYLRFSIPAYTWAGSISIADSVPSPFPSGTRRFYTSTSVSEEIVFAGGTVFFLEACQFVTGNREAIGTGTYSQSISGDVKIYQANGASPPTLLESGTYECEITAAVNFFAEKSAIYFEFDANQVSFDSWNDDFGTPSGGANGYSPLTFSGVKCAKFTSIPGFGNIPPSTGCTTKRVDLARWNNLEFTPTPPDVCGSTVVNLDMDLKNQFIPGFSPRRCIFKYGPMHSGVWAAIGDWSGSCDGGTQHPSTGVPVGSPCPCGSITGTKQYVTI